MKLKKVMALVMSSAMILATLAGCGSKEAATDTQEPAAEEVKEEAAEAPAEEAAEETEATEEEAAEAPAFTEVVELDVYGNNYVGTEDYPWWENWLSENLGVVLRSRPAGDNVISTMLASGDLADITFFQNEADFMAAAEAGLIINLEDYKDQLPALFEQEVYDIYRPWATEKYGGLYGVPYYLGAKSGMSNNAHLRWDAYEAIGCPEINNEDEMLDALKEMQDAIGTTASGDPVYAMGYFTSWGDPVTSHAWQAEGWAQGWDVAYFPADFSAEPQFWYNAEGSAYLDGIKWMNKAYQMGIFDPDAVTMDYDTYNAHACNGKYLFVPWSWFNSFNNLDNNSANGIGYMSAHPAFNHFKAVKTNDLPVGNNWYFTVNANSENLDAALRFLNWMMSYEGNELIMNGPEGWSWEYDADGVRVYTDAYKEAVATAGNHDLPDGGSDYYALGVFGEALTGYNVNPNTGVPLSLSAQYRGVSFTELSTLDANWRETTGLNHITNVFEQWDSSRIVNSHPATGFIAGRPEEYNEIINSIAPSLKELLWKMIYAESEAEIDEMWVEMCAIAEEGGYYEVFEAYCEAQKAGLDMYNSYAE